MWLGEEHLAKHSADKDEGHSKISGSELRMEERWSNSWQMLRVSRLEGTASRQDLMWDLPAEKVQVPLFASRTMA